MYIFMEFVFYVFCFSVIVLRNLWSPFQSYAHNFVFWKVWW